MVLNLMKGGHALRAHGRRAESMQPLKRAGAARCASAAEAARGSDVIFVMVADTPDVEQVIFGTNGVAEGAAGGSVVVDMSTISPVATRSMAARLADKGVEMPTAPGRR
jgi:3-hydroxyisobutyrate dehydrogenase-like beta-hydroxyacid dehydrogenase